MTTHTFTPEIKRILQDLFGKDADEVFEKSLLLQYINLKTKSANKGSKARGSFANLYAIYVIVEDYIANDFQHKEEAYSVYDGAQFSQLFKRQRELPFGSKLQNHALNNRMNSEFEKFFPTSQLIPIIRNMETNRYWINESLLIVNLGNNSYNIGEAIIKVIDKYIETKQDSFKRFIDASEELSKLGTSSPDKIHSFIDSLLAPNSDARLFEIASYAILKYFYYDQSIIWGYDMASLVTENLKLYKTGRTNANDGGIDFVMKPLGRFFQVTETLDFKKYFLDIEKIERYPISFVIKSDEDDAILLTKLKSDALKTYPVKSIVDKYMSCIEEIINIPKLKSCLFKVEQLGNLNKILEEIIIQSKVEFNYEEDEEDSDVDEAIQGALNFED